MNEINAAPINVIQLLKNNNFYIPSYQRGYAWNEENSSQLFNDIRDHFDSEDKNEYFMGNIIYFRQDKGIHDEWVIVDGQQRITTFMLLITALRISLMSSKILSRDEKNELDKLFEKLLFSEETDTKNNKKIKLFSNGEIIMSKILNFDSSNSGDDLKIWWNRLSDEFSETNYYKNLRIYMDHIFKDILTYKDYEQFYKNLKSIVFIAINIGAERDVHQIFENINSKGLELSLGDLIKNYLYILLERQDPKNKKNLEKKISIIFDEKIRDLKLDTSRFFSNYLIYLKSTWFEKTNEKQVYLDFKNYINNTQNETIENIILEIEKQLSLYEYVSNFITDSSSNEFEFGLFMNKQNLLSLIFPILYKFSENNLCFEKEKFIVNNKFQEIIILLDKFFLRRHLVNLNNKNFNKAIPTWLTKMKNIDITNLKHIEKMLTQDIDKENGSLMPTMHDVLRIFDRDLSPYKTKKSKNLVHIMLKINFYDSSNSQEGVSLNERILKKITVEHIFPQKPDNNSLWIETINQWRERQDIDTFEDSLELLTQNWGNITITEDNSKLSNKDFILKKTHFNDSIFKINKYIVQNEFWTMTEIEKRKKFIREIIEKHF